MACTEDRTTHPDAGTPRPHPSDRVHPGGYHLITTHLTDGTIHWAYPISLECAIAGTCHCGFCKALAQCDHGACTNVVTGHTRLCGPCTTATRHRRWPTRWIRTHA